jgi:hypothetical protein
MFGQNKPVAFDPYGRRRSPFRLPRWLVLLIVGIAIGVAGVLVAQERYMAPRLSAEDSVTLQKSFEQADADRTHLKAQLADTGKKLDAALVDKKNLSDELATSRTLDERQRDEMAAVLASLPPDPRGGTVDVRTGMFALKGGALTYTVVLTRDRATKPMPGLLQLSVEGQTAHGSETTTALKPVALTIGAYEVVRGSAPLPDGFKPRQATIQILDRPAGKSLGMRVILVK